MAINRARQLRRNATEAEKVLWRALRSLQATDVKFRRQYPIDKYIVDFAAPRRHLIIEVDGGQHAHDSPDRTRTLESLGYLVIRFWNNDVLNNLDGVLDEIARVLRGR